MYDLSVVSVSLFFFFFVSLIVISVYISHPREISAEGFFFANRNVHWLFTGTSLLTSWMFSLFAFGAVSFVPDVRWIVSCAAVSLAMVALLGWGLGPMYLRMKIDTLPEFFERRFNRGCRLFLSAVYVLFNIVVRLMVILVAARIVIGRIAGVDPFSTLLFFLFVTGIYVVIGGLRAEIYASLVQTLIIIVVSAGLVGWAAVNGAGGTETGSGGLVSLLSPGRAAETGYFTGGLMLGLPIIAFWFWCIDQFVVQKVQSVRSVHSLRRAAVSAGLLQIVLLALMFFEGSAVLSALTQERGIGGVSADDPLPVSLRVASIIAVAGGLMALFASVFNSTTSLVTLDLYRSFRPSASERTLLLVGRMSTIVMLLCSILLVPLSQTIQLSLCLSLFKAFVYFSALVAAVFAIGLMSKTVGAASAVTTLCFGLIVIVLRGTAETVSPGHRLDASFVEWFAGSEPSDFTVFMFVISVVLLFSFQKLGAALKLSRHFPGTFRSMCRKLRDRWILRRTVL